ncbi:DUF3613 domain-containing protein [Burkholderia guangdongensis]|uniref:DUF3613 domain-containing protein n=1 Tax=Burkholderia guangdongensis TaxID=1792500 RepID=UPI0015C87642|nr:DUF3613 domain-containing protein [Burkholderia guangdongensis]
MNNDKMGRNGCAGRIAVLCAIVCAALGTTAAYGQDGAPNASDVERSTNEWLALQRENRAAAPVQPVLGDVATIVYQRYVDSFKNKIPDSMSSQLGGGGSGGGGSGGGQAAQ